jgi:uncharacterized membrane protein (UPF0182 family)
VILQPFVPVSEDNQQTRLISFMTAKSDPRNYGEMDAFVTPQGQNVIGPVQAANAIESDQEIAQTLSLLRGEGSDVVLGKLQLLPLGNSVAYIQPVFVQQEGSQGFPQFRQVAVFTGNRAVLANTVAEGLANLLGAPTTEPTDPGGPTSPTTPEDGQTAAELLTEAKEKFAQAQDALTAGDLGRYQELVQEAEELVDRAISLLAAGDDSVTTTTSRPAQAAKVG